LEVGEYQKGMGFGTDWPLRFVRSQRRSLAIQ